MFKNLKPLVVEVRTSSEAGSGKAAYGSAFVVSPAGLLLTNYHVVSAVLQNRSRTYKVFVVEKENEPQIQAQVLGVDLIHDLALLRVPRRFPSAFEFAADEPRHGDRLYSLGTPEDLSLSIIEGISNGSIKYGPYERLHISSPLNAGMSGGPTLNQAGQVVGVNVAILRGTNNILRIVRSKQLFPRPLQGISKVRPLRD